MVSGPRVGRSAAGFNQGRGDVLIAVAIGMTIAGLGLADGGFFASEWTWASFAAAWALALTVYLRDRIAVSRLELAFVGGLGALVCWAALSSLWSSDWAESLHEAERLAFYAVALLVVLLLASRSTPAWILGGVLGGVLVVIAVGLVHFLFVYGGRPPHEFEGYLLHLPVGYANAIGVLASMGIVLALGLALHASPALRPALLASLVPLSAALYLSGSKGAGIALVVGLGALLTLDCKRSWSVVGLSAVAFTGALWVSANASLEEGPVRFDANARALGIELVLLAAVVAVCARVVSSRWRVAGGRGSLPRGPGRVVAARVVVTAVALLIGLRVGVPSTSWQARGEYWDVAWEQWRSSPVLGGGAGSFGDYAREAGLDVRDAHNLYLETLSELGPVGLSLLLFALAVPLAAARRARRKGLVPTATATYLVFLVHAGIDWDWEMPVVALAALLCGGALLVAARERESMAELETRPWPLAAAIGIVSIAVVELFANGALSVGG